MKRIVKIQRQRYDVLLPIQNNLTIERFSLIQPIRRIRLIVLFVGFAGLNCLTFISKAQAVNDSGFEKKCYQYSFSNTDRHKFGKKDFADSPGISVNSIARMGKYIYLTDPIHSNVKQIDVMNGKIRCSQKLDKSEMLIDVVAFGSNIYVITRGSVIFILDHSLRLVDTIRLHQEVDVRQLLVKNEAVYSFSPGSDVDQSKSTFEFTIKATRIDLSQETVILTTPKGYVAYQEFINGYSVDADDSCLKIGDKTRCFDSIGYLYNDYETTRSVCVDAFSVTYFTFTKNQLEVCSYTWDH